MGVQEKMRDRMEKFVVLPFSMGCVSQASVAVVEQMPKKPKVGLQSPTSRTREDDEHSSMFLALSRPNLSTGVNRIVKGFKSLSQFFVYEDEMEELGMEIEIGNPTDVKHVTHIGWDSLASTNPFVDWDDMDMGTTSAILKQSVHEINRENASPTIGWDSLAGTNPFVDWDDVYMRTTSAILNQTEHEIVTENATPTVPVDASDH